MSIKLAQKINGEIISADSMQIYNKMDIGTAKVTKEEMQDIKHYLIDIKNAEEKYSVSEFVEDAKKAVKEIIEKGKTPIIIGGTGLYVNSLVYGYEFEKTEKNEQEEFRKKLDEEIENGIETLETLYQKAREIDEEAASKISVKDRKRIYRILEIYHIQKETKTNLDKKRIQNAKTQKIQIEMANEKTKETEIKEIEIEYKVFNILQDRTFLYDLINNRIGKMLKEGLVEEVEEILMYLKTKNIPSSETTSMQAIGYKEVVQYLQKQITYEEMKENLCKNTRHYAKRQITWFKKTPKEDLDYTELAKTKDIQKTKEMLDEKYLNKIIRSIF